MDELRNLSYSRRQPWLLLGDVNEISHISKVRGGTFSAIGTSTFYSMIDDCNLLDIGTSGKHFTVASNLVPP